MFPDDIASGSTDRDFALREPCAACGCEYGVVVNRNGQDVAHCAECDRYCYCVPKTESGKAQRTASTVHNGIRPKQRARVLARATGRCELCGAPGSDRPLHVGHVLSVERGLAHGLTERELNDDENLCAMCEECNLGVGKEPVSIRLLVSLAMARIRRGEAP